MKRRSAALIFLFVSVQLVFANAPACKEGSIAGLWYGTYQIGNGNPYRITMEFTVSRKCEISGIISWPEYFNSKSRFECTYDPERARYDLTETTIFQGYEYIPGIYEFELNGDELTGKSTTVESTYQLTRATAMPSEDRSQFELAINELEVKYGVAQIGDTLDRAVVLSKIEAVQQNIDPGFEGFDIRGSASLGGFEVPMTITYQFPDLMHMKLNIQTMTFQTGQNGFVSWEYNGFEDQLTVDSLSENDSDKSPFEKSFGDTYKQSLDNGYAVSSVKSATVDSVECYRLLLEKEESWKVFYFDTEQLDLRREESDYQIKHFHHYVDVGTGGFRFPTSFVNMESNGTVSNFSFADITINNTIDPTVFDIPEELIHKYKPNQVIMDFYDEAERYFEAEEYGKAQEYYSKAINESPDAPDYYFKRGICKVELEDYYSAISDFEQALKLDPDNEAYHNRKGVAKFRLGDYKNAVPDFVKAFELDSTYDVALHNNAMALYRLDLVDSSHAYFKRAIQVEEPDLDYVINYAAVSVELDKLEEGIEGYRLAIALSDTINASLYNRLGVAHFRSERYDSAQQYFETAYSNSEDNYQIIKNLGVNNYYLGESKVAAKYMEEAFKLDDTDADLLNYLGLTYHDLEDYDGAIFYYDKAIEQSRDAGYFDNRAYAKSSLGKYSEAIDDFTTSIQLYPDDSEIFYQRGLLYNYVHNTFDACRDFKAASDLGNEKAAEALKEYCNIEGN